MEEEEYEMLKSQIMMKRLFNKANGICARGGSLQKYESNQTVSFKEMLRAGGDLVTRWKKLLCMGWL